MHTDTETNRWKTKEKPEREREDGNGKRARRGLFAYNLLKQHSNRLNVNLTIKHKKISCEVCTLTSVFNFISANCLRSRARGIGIKIFLFPTAPRLFLRLHAPLSPQFVFRSVSKRVINWDTLNFFSSLPLMFCIKISALRAD